MFALEDIKAGNPSISDSGLSIRILDIANHIENSMPASQGSDIQRIKFLGGLTSIAIM